LNRLEDLILTGILLVLSQSISYKPCIGMDNAVVIAMAVRSSPKKRKLGIIVCAGVAVVLRIILTFLVLNCLQ